MRTVFFATALLVAMQSANAVPVQWAGNGHYYEVVASSEITWMNAYQSATALTHLGQSGYLATVTSAPEQAFVASLLGGGFQYWIGGYQAAGAPGPNANWNWDTVEPWGYTNWASQQPDDNGGCGGQESFLTINLSYGMAWNDEDDPGCVCHGLISGYVVEYGGTTGSLGQTPGGCAGPGGCGDASCGGGETCQSCPLDCGTCPHVGVPTMSAWGLALLGLGVLTGGSVVVQRRMQRVACPSGVFARPKQPSRRNAPPGRHPNPP